MSHLVVVASKRDRCHYLKEGVKFVQLANYHHGTECVVTYENINVNQPGTVLITINLYSITTHRATVTYVIPIELRF